MSDAIGDRLDSAIAAIEALRAQSDALLAMGEAIIAGIEAGGTLMTVLLFPRMRSGRSAAVAF